MQRKGARERERDSCLCVFVFARERKRERVCVCVIKGTKERRKVKKTMSVTSLNGEKENKLEMNVFFEKKKIALENEKEEWHRKKRQN